MALHNGKDVVGCAPTEAGKTLSFWIPLLMAREEGLDKMSVVVTPLNLLGKQNVDMLEKAGISAVSVTGNNTNTKTFKDIADGKYHVVVVNPEILMEYKEMRDMFTKPKVTSRILNFIFDEGHCICQWGKFRKDYLAVGALRYLIPDHIPFYVASATLPPEIISELQEILRLRTSNTEYILRSNDRPDVHPLVRLLVNPANGFKDLAFLIPDGYKMGSITVPPPKFVVFFDDTRETQDTWKYLRTQLPEALQNKVRYFHATMTPTYREDETTKFANLDVWGMCCTDTFGMHVDIPDIDIVVQFKATCNLCMLWQRFGRAARASDKEGTAILLVEKKDTNEGRSAKVKAQENKKMNLKRKASTELQQPTPKRPALGGSKP